MRLQNLSIFCTEFVVKYVQSTFLSLSINEALTPVLSIPRCSNCAFRSITRKSCIFRADIGSPPAGEAILCIVSNLHICTAHATDMTHSPHSALGVS